MHRDWSGRLFRRLCFCSWRREELSGARISILSYKLHEIGIPPRLVEPLALCCEPSQHVNTPSSSDSVVWWARWDVWGDALACSLGSRKARDTELRQT
jgi:hypothetical protein